MLQKSLVRPQSNDGRNGESRGQAFVASALTPGTVTLSEVEAAGDEDMPMIEESSDDEAMGVEEEDEEARVPKDDTIAEEEAKGEVEEEARVPKTKKAPVGLTAAEL